MLSGMMHGRVFDLTALVNMVAAISVCLAIAFWLFSVARFFWSSEKHDGAAGLSLAAFAGQLGLVVLAVFIDPRGVGYVGVLLALANAAVLSLLNIAWAHRSSTTIGSRMRVATLLWVAGVILAVSTPQH